MVKKNMVPMPWFIRAIREGLGMTQQQFAAKLGVSSQVVVSRWEAGKHAPDPRSVKKINEIYNKFPRNLKDRISMTPEPGECVGGFLVLWQHDETGRTCELPEGEHPGDRWYRVGLDDEEEEEEEEEEEDV